MKQILNRFYSSNLSKNAFGVYKHALVRSIDDSLAKLALRQKLPNGVNDYVNIHAAKLQHKEYTNALKSLGLIIHELPSNGFPDSVFIEDCLVAIDDTLMITSPGAITRNKEIVEVKNYLINENSLNSSNSLKRKYVIRELEGGTLDGGDVLFTGKEILIGKSFRTNSIGIDSMRRAFGNVYPVHEIDLNILQTRIPNDDESNPLHLKSICSMGAPNVLLLGGKYRGALQDIVAKLCPHLNYVSFPDEGMANCLFVNGTIVRRCDWEYPESASVWKESILSEYNQIQVPNAELAKVDGALTCCSVLIK